MRFDGGHKKNTYLTGVLSEHFDFVHVCPEVGIGLTVPRPTIRLIRTDGGTVEAVTTNEPDENHTAALRQFAEETVPGLAGVCGYILKSGSPSCGMERVRVYEDENRPPERSGVGIYAEEIMRAMPNLPVEEEGRLNDPRLRENFLERVFVYQRWLDMKAAGITPRALVEFHTAHKFSILAHDEPVYRELGRLVADCGKGDIDRQANDYVTLLMKGLKVLASPKKHANVLMHIAGFFKEQLAADDKAELLRLIDAHREGLVPLVVPITLINYFRKKYHQPYIEGQLYLEPHPPELMLRNML